MTVPQAAIWRLALVGYFLVGTVALFFPPLIPALMRDYGIGPAVAALIFPAKSLGTLAGGMAAGLFSDRYGRKPLLSLSALGLAVGLALAAAADRWSLFVLGFSLQGLAQGALSTSVNALAADVHAGSQARGLNVLHGVYGLGAGLAPLIVSGMVSWGAAWRLIMGGAAAAWLILAVWFFRAPLPPGSVPGRRLTRVTTLAAEPIFWLLGGVAFLYNGIAWSLLGWTNAYLDERGARQAVWAGLLIGGFYGALTAGRFACAHWAERMGYARTLLACAIGSFLAYPIVVLAHLQSTLALGLIACGLFLSGLYPTAVAYGTRRYPHLAGTLSGGLSLFMSAGAMIPPWWTGILAQHWGFQGALAFNDLMVLPLLAVCWGLARGERTLAPASSGALTEVSGRAPEADQSTPMR